MEKSKVLFMLQRKLTILCGGVTSAVLIIILVIAWLNTEKQWEISRKQAFEERFSYVSSMVRSSKAISHTALGEIELKNQAVIGIEDNGVPFLYHGAYQTATERKVLIKRLREASSSAGIDTSVGPASLKEIESPVLMVKGEQNDAYLGAVFVTKKGDGYRSLFMLQSLSGVWERKGQMVLYGVFALAGSMALFAISFWFVGKALKPVVENEKKQVEFIAAASHELRSPLAVIRANAAALNLFCQYGAGIDRKTREDAGDRKKPISQEEAGRFTAGIEKECARMARLIDDLLLLANADANTWRVELGQVDLDTLLIEVYDLFYPYFLEHKMILDLEIKEEILPEITGDRERIRQILTILLKNAAAYSRKGDKVILRGSYRRNACIIEVEDHGTGIPEDKKELIFERFYRGDDSRKDKNHYGLGLSIAGELIHLHRGEINVMDTKGGGATFQIRLPVSVNKNLKNF